MECDFVEERRINKRMSELFMNALALPSLNSLMLIFIHFFQVPVSVCAGRLGGVPLSLIRVRISKF